MSEQPRSTASRPYRMRKRAEQVEETRQRIVDAAVDLHTTTGPADTTISAIAGQAGVTRLTVYRHFPDTESLFTACARRWSERHPAPDPATWRAIPDLEERARRALRELYAWYDECGDGLLAIMRDREAMPRSTREETDAEFRALADALVVGTGVRGRARRRLRATAGLLVSIWTWQSLTVEEGLTTHDAAELGVSLLTCAARRPVR